MVKRMWAGGPFRRWSPVRTSGCPMPLAGGGFGGSYVCGECQRPVAGVYRVIDRVQRRESWLCDGCRSQGLAEIAAARGKGRTCYQHAQALRGMALPPF